MVDRPAMARPELAEPCVITLAVVRGRPDVGGPPGGAGRRSRRLDPVQTFVTQRRRSSHSPVELRHGGS